MIMIDTILTVGGGVLLILLGIIGFFLRQFYTTIKEMSVSLGNLHLEVKLLKLEFTNNGKNMTRLEMIIEEHKKKIDKNIRDITEIIAAQNNCPVRNKKPK